LSCLSLTRICTPEYTSFHQRPCNGVQQPQQESRPKAALRKFPLPRTTAPTVERRQKNMYHYIVPIQFSLFFVSPLIYSSASLAIPTCGRHICLFENYECIQGPYFSALFDQLFTQTQLKCKNMVYCTSKYDLVGLRNNDNIHDTGGLLDELMKSLCLDHIQLVVLDDLNPVSLETLFTTGDSSHNPNNKGNQEPSIFWVQGRNAFWTRHLLRTSGFDRLIHQKC
jgi:hypothetical protein